GTGGGGGGGSAPSPGAGEGAVHRPLDLLVGLDVPAGLDGGVEGAVGLLRLVGELDPGEVHGDLVGGDDVAVARAAGLVAADQQLGHLDAEDLLLLLAGLAADQRALLDVPALGAGQHQLGRGLVVLHDEVEVLHGHLAGAAAAAGGERARLALAPGPRL